MTAVLESILSDPKASPSAVCPRCAGTGWERVAHHDMTGVRRCRDPWHVEELLSKAQVPISHAHCTLENFDAAHIRRRRARQRAQYYVDRFAAEGLWIQGPAASGKTHLAVGIVRALLERGYRGIRFYSTAALLHALDPRGATADRRDRARLRAEALKARLLVLDDLDCTAGSRGELNALNDLIDVRERASLPILVTTCGGKTELRRAIGARAAFAIAALCPGISLANGRGREPVGKDYLIEV